MEKLKDEIHDKGNGHLLKLEDVVSILDVLVDEAKSVVEAELLPDLYKYIELCSNPRPESRVREEDIRFLLLK